jgi:hypothetical protein
MKYPLLFLLFALLSLLFLRDTTLIEAENKLIEIDHYPREAMWSGDSQQFVYFSKDVGQARLEIPEEDWVSYNVVSQTLTEATDWQLQPELSEAELELLKPAVGENGEMSFIYESPSGDYIVCLCDGISIYSREQQQIAHTNYTVYNPFSGPDSFSVIWSADESAFVFTVLSELGYSFSGYGSNYAVDVENTVVVPVEPVIKDKQFKFLVGGINDKSLKVHDISSDGRWVLLTARHDDPTIFQTSFLPFALIVWDTTDSDNSYILENVDVETFLAASFIGESNLELFIVTTEDLFSYQLQSKAKKRLRSDIAADLAYFSPDGNFLSLICCRTNVSAYQLQILDLRTP